jgi:hypothetical protein
VPASLPAGTEAGATIRNPRSEIAMGLFKRKPTGPRTVCCPNCGGVQDIAAAAQSVVCRHCNVSIKVGNEKITQYAATVSLETCGSVVIEKKGALVVQKRVVASELTVKGSLKGTTIVYDSAHIFTGAQMVGDLTARVLIVDDGATLKGHIEVNPSAGALIIEPPAELAGKPKSY